MKVWLQRLAAVHEASDQAFRVLDWTPKSEDASSNSEERSKLHIILGRVNATLSIDVLQSGTCFLVVRRCTAFQRDYIRSSMGSWVLTTSWNDAE